MDAERLLKVTNVKLCSNACKSKEVTTSFHFKNYYFSALLGASIKIEKRNGLCDIYLLPLILSFFQTYNIKFYCYADDTLLYYYYYLIVIIVVVCLHLGLMFEIMSHWLH